jgi:hypothetical protein
MTGRGAGFCAGYDAPGFENPGRGRGGGWGRGFMGGRGGRGRGGFGNRNRYWATGMTGWQREGGLEQMVEDLRKRIEELEKERS